MLTERPSLTSTVIKSYLRTFVKPTPLWAHFYVTRHCNFNCKYCGARDNTRKDPSFKEICERFLKLKKLGCNCIALMGGEPTLRPDIVEIVEFCSDNNIYTQLSTNGVFLTNPLRTKNKQTLLKQLVKAGLGTVNLSVDSVASNFKVSGKELPKASNVLDALINEKENSGLTLMLNCVITKKNIKQVPAMLEFCHSKNIMMAAIFVQNPKPSEKLAKSSYLNNILFQKTDKKMVEDMADFLISKKKAGYTLLEPIKYYQSAKDWINGKLNWVCDGGKYTLEVDTDGKVGVCGYLSYLEVNLMDLPDNYYEKLQEKREKALKWCTKKCLSSCMFCTSYYRQDPVGFIYSKLRYR